MATKKPSTRDACEYLCTVRDKLQDHSETYDTFVKVLKDYHAKRICPREVRSKVIDLLTGHEDLLMGFNTFLPEGSKITLGSNDQTLPRKPEFRDAIEFVNKVKARFEDGPGYMSFLEILKLHREGKKRVAEVYHEVSEVLLRDHPDLREEFVFFLPDSYSHREE